MNEKLTLPVYPAVKVMASFALLGGVMGGLLFVLVQAVLEGRFMPVIQMVQMSVIVGTIIGGLPMSMVGMWLVIDRVCLGSQKDYKLVLRRGLFVNAICFGVIGLFFQQILLSIVPIILGGLLSVVIGALVLPKQK